MNRRLLGTTLIRVALATALALLVAPVFRGITQGLNQTLGTMWPFSLTHCSVVTAPGCEGQGAVQAAREGGRAITWPGR